MKKWEGVGKGRRGAGGGGEGGAVAGRGGGGIEDREPVVLPLKDLSACNWMLTMVIVVEFWGYAFLEVCLTQSVSS